MSCHVNEISEKSLLPRIIKLESSQNQNNSKKHIALLKTKK
jgi:hypothetical protein